MEFGLTLLDPSLTILRMTFNHKSILKSFVWHSMYASEQSALLNLRCYSIYIFEFQSFNVFRLVLIPYRFYFQTSRKDIL